MLKDVNTGSNEANKADLLNQLKIDSNDDAPANHGGGLVWGIAAACVCVAGLGLWMWQGSSTQSDTINDAQQVLDNRESKSALQTASESRTDRGNGNAENSGVVQSSDDLERSKSNPNSEEILNASGYVTARRSATVSAEIMGRIESVLVEEGMFVEEGDILARIDSSVAKIDWELSAARAVSTEQRIAALKSERSEARRILMRLESLDEKQFSSEAEVTRAQVNVLKLDAEINALASDLDVNRLTVKRQKQLFDKHTLRAPFSGVVIVKNAQPGEIIAPSSAGGGFTRTGICTIVDMDSLEVEVDVNEAYIRRVSADQKVLVNLDAYPKWDIPAKVIAVIPTADRAKATVRVRIGFLINDAKILPDMGVKVAFFSEINSEDDNND